MTRRVVEILSVILCLCIVLCGCGSSSDTWKADEVSKDVQPYIERAVEIIDSYLAFEVSAAEADSNFSELLARFEPLNVTERDLEKHFTDIMAAHNLQSFEYNTVSKRTDIELRQCRDILAFQIGEDVSGNAYPVEAQSNLFDEDGVPSALQNLVMPAASTMFSVSNGSCIVSVGFDAVNGVAPSELYEYTNAILGALSETPCTIYVSYKYYGQLVFSMYLSASGESFTGTFSKVTKDKDDTIVEIKSDEDLKASIDSTAKFLGKYNIPSLG